MIKTHIDFRVKYPLFLSDFNKTRIFSTHFLKNTQILNFMKIHPVTAELYHENRRTDITKLTVAFHNSANVPKTHLLCTHTIHEASIVDIANRLRNGKD